MSTLPHHIIEKLDFHSEQGNVFYDQDNFRAAIDQWLAALETLPEPQSQWEAYTWLTASIGDARYLLEEYSAAKQYLFDALNGPDGDSNPFIHYRLGQCQIHLGEKSSGVQSLLKTYMLDGTDIFEDDEHGDFYLKILRDQKLIDQ